MKKRFLVNILIVSMLVQAVMPVNQVKGEVLPSDSIVSANRTIDSTELSASANRSGVNKKIITTFGYVNRLVDDIMLTEKAELSDLLKLLPDTIDAYCDAEIEPIEIPVTWQCTVDYEVTEQEEYVFIPVWDSKEYSVSDTLSEADIPYIRVQIDQMHMSVSWINPIYEDVSYPYSRQQPQNIVSYALSDSAQSFDSVRGCANYLKANMVNRVTDVAFECTDTNADWSTVLNQIMDMVYEENDNTPVREGDYLLLNTYGYDCEGLIATGSYSYTLSFSYWSNSAQEQLVDTKVNQILTSLNLSSTSEYEKILAVYNYLQKSVSYDRSLQKHSTYNALCEGTSVCQGYSSALHRLLKELDVSTRAITGDAAGGKHAWNIARIGSVYYNLDPTWDESIGMSGYLYHWFLKSPTDFSNHVRDAEYSTTAFNNRYPMSSVSYDASTVDNDTTNLVTAQFVAPMKVLVNWNAVSGAEAYEVFRSNSLNGTYISLGKTISTSYSDLSVKAGTTVFYKVCVVKNGILCQKSVAGSCVVPPTVVNIVSGTIRSCATVTAINVNNDVTSMRVAVWSEVNGQDDLKWYAATNINGTWSVAIDTINHGYDTGKYQVHAYATSAGGTEKCVGVTAITMDNNDMIISSQKDAKDSYFTVTLQNARIGREASGVMVAVWSEVNGQDDLVWYNATRQGNTTYQIAVPISNHKNSTGRYQIHAYTKTFVGRMEKCLKTTSITIGGISSGEVKILNQNNANGTFRAEISKVSSAAGITGMRLAVWSEANGQDDLKWYTAKNSNGVWVADIDTINHGYDTGRYQVHAYATDGREIEKCVCLKTVLMETDNKNITIASQKDARDSSFTVTLQNVKIGREASGVMVAVWSEVNGQDDLVWYNATRQGNKTYQIAVPISNHKNSTGRYQIHAYTKTFIGGAEKCLKTTSLTIGGISSGEVKILNQNNANGTFRAEISKVSSAAGITGMRLAVWSEVNGQDDLKWYTAKNSNGVWVADIDTINHGYDTGRYQVHAYATDGREIEKCVCLKTVLMETDNKNITIASQKDARDSSFTVTLQNVKIGREASGVMVAVWSEVNGQDDLVWYNATRQGNTTYQIAVPISNHKNSTGRYQIHAYTKTFIGGMEKCLKTTSLTISGISVSNVSSSISNMDTYKGTFRLNMQGTITSTAPIDKLQVAVWSDMNGQDDLKWYTAKNSAGNWYIDVSAANHKFDGGTYYLHAYVYDARGVTQFVTAVVTTVSINSAYLQQTGTQGIDVSKYQGNINWNAVKNAGVEFAMIRAGYRGSTQGQIYEDPYFQSNITNAIAAGVSVGVYFFSQAISDAEAAEEALWVVNRISPYYVTYPVAIDTEYLSGARANALSASARTSAVKTFAQTVQNAGYNPIIYANKNWLLNNLHMSDLTSYDTWLAHYTSVTDYPLPYAIWQYTSKGRVDGINGNVDLNVLLKRY